MKKRSIIWAVILIVGIACTIAQRCKAEGYDPWSGDPWQPPSWDFGTPEPYITPSPEPSSMPELPEASEIRGGGSSGMRSEEDPYLDTRESIDQDGLKGTISYAAASYSYVYGRTTLYLYYLSAWGSHSQTVNMTSQNSPWATYNAVYATTYDNSTFGRAKSLPNTNTVFAFDQNPSLEGIVVMMRYTPNNAEIWNNQMNVIHRLQWDVRSTTPGIPANAPYTLDEMLDYYTTSDTDDTDSTCTVFYQIVPLEGQAIWQSKTVSLDELRDYQYNLDFSLLPDGITIKWVNISVVINFFPAANPWVRATQYWYLANSPSTPKNQYIYPSITFSPSNSLSTRFTIDYTEKAKDRSWLSRLISGIFVPDPDRIRGIIMGAIADEDSAGIADLITFREQLYDHIAASTGDAVLTIPAINVPIGENQTAHIFDGYSFNLTDFYENFGFRPEGQRVSTLLEAVQFILSCLLFSGFFASLWAIVTRIFGLNLFAGVHGEDPVEDD